MRVYLGYLAGSVGLMCFIEAAIETNDSMIIALSCSGTLLLLAFIAMKALE